MGLSTKNIQTGSNSVSKIIQPGSTTLKVNSVYLQEFPYQDGAYHLIFDCETKPIDNFEGFYIDKDDHSKGRHEGQVGRIKANEWAYSDSVLPSGIEIHRDLEILKFVRVFCEATDCLDWFTKVDNKYDTIEEFITAFNKKKPFEDVYFNACVAGKEYENKNGYMSFDLSFPKIGRNGVPVEAENATIPNLITFNESTHIKRKPAPETVESFEKETDFEIDLDD